MTNSSQWREEQRVKRNSLTALNEATTRAFRACRGSHVPSGRSVSRDFGGELREIRICLRCAVPYDTPKGWGVSPKRGSQAGSKVRWPK